ncbi:MAG: hypothetical protein ACI9C4_003272 [Paraglaciecola sp.]|jgi:hypothetical protein
MTKRVPLLDVSGLTKSARHDTGIKQVVGFNAISGQYKYILKVGVATVSALMYFTKSC